MVYQNIVRLCKEHNISIAKLEKACNIGNGVIAAWANSQPRLDKIKAVADYFGVTVDELMQEPKESK